MSVSLQVLAERIQREVNIQAHDVEPCYLPNQREIRSLSQLSLDLLIKHKRELCEAKELKQLELSQALLSELLDDVSNNIQKHGRWSFWHYSALCLVTCFSYYKLLKENKHKTIALESPATWDNPTLDVPVLTINYIATRLYPTALQKIQEEADKPDVNLSTICRYLARQMNLVTA